MVLTSIDTMKRDQRPYEQPDLDSIEELNYISTLEEDAVIDAHIEELRKWGYGSITHVHDLHQLFWEFARRGIILDKLFRVAVVECIDEEPLYTKFLGMAKHYNGWAQRQKKVEALDQKDLKKTIAEKNEQIETVRKNYREAMATIGKQNNEIIVLKQAAKQKSEGALIFALRHELKKEYNIKLNEMRHKDKPYKLVGRALVEGLMNPCSRFFETFDFTKEKDVKEYIAWFRMADRKINTSTLKIITDQYGEVELSHFLAKVTAHNEEWMSRNIEADNE